MCIYSSWSLMVLHILSYMISMSYYDEIRAYSEVYPQSALLQRNSSPTAQYLVSEKRLDTEPIDSKNENLQVYISHLYICTPIRYITVIRTQTQAIIVKVYYPCTLVINYYEKKNFLLVDKMRSKEMQMHLRFRLAKRIPNENVLMCLFKVIFLISIFQDVYCFSKWPFLEISQNTIKMVLYVILVCNGM